MVRIRSDLCAYIFSYAVKQNARYWTPHSNMFLGAFLSFHVFSKSVYSSGIEKKTDNIAFFHLYISREIILPFTTKEEKFLLVKSFPVIRFRKHKSGKIHLTPAAVRKQ